MILLFFGNIPLCTIAIFLSLTEDMDYSPVKGFLEFLSILFAIVNTVFFQILGTCVVLALTVITIVYPPINTFALIRSIMKEKF